MKFVPEDPVDCEPPLFQINAWQQIVDKPLPEEIMAYIIDGYMRHSAAKVVMGLVTEKWCNKLNVLYVINLMSKLGIL